EVDIVVAPCRGFQSAEATLGEFVNQVLPVVTFAISEPQLSPSDQAELRDLKEKFSLPIFLVPVSEPRGAPGRARSPLQRQLLELELLSPGCPCGVPGAPLPERLRLLSAFSRQVLQQHLVRAATRLSELHGRCLNIFINQAFDMQRDLQITPKRLEYTRRKESELYESLMGIANRKQEEMKDMIVETLGSMKEELLEDAASMDFRGGSCLEGQEGLGVGLDVFYVYLLCSGLFWLSLSLPCFLCSFLFLSLPFALSPLIIQRLTWVSPPAISSDWKRKVAQDAIESLSASKLAKSICSQFRTRLNSSHEAFAASLRQVRG
ncbi:DUSTY kinase, partial [Copsychus sechellarum]|nr:DUSTY kinase [Copsychus sechellarum]